MDAALPLLADARMTIRVLIVDDEPLARRGIRARLAEHEDVTIIGECGSGREAIARLRDDPPDLVFLDVQMPGCSGFDVIHEVGVDAMPVVVFVTAFDEHALRAFEVHALDYLLKPIDNERFRRVVDRARRHLQDRRGRTIAERLAAVLDDVARPAVREAATPRSRMPARLVVKHRGRMLLLDPLDVDWVEAEGDYVRIHSGGQRFLIRSTLAAFEAQLDPERFARIHRSTIVNIARVRELQPFSQREYVVVLSDGTRLKLSRSYRSRLAALIGEDR